MMRRMTSISAEVLPMKVFKAVVDMLKMLWRLVISIQLGEEEAVHEGDDLHQCRDLAHEGLQGCVRHAEDVKEASDQYSAGRRRGST